MRKDAARDAEKWVKRCGKMRLEMRKDAARDVTFQGVINTFSRLAASFSSVLLIIVFMHNFKKLFIRNLGQGFNVTRPSS
jgi:hypothetical protein